MTSQTVFKSKNPLNKGLINIHGLWLVHTLQKEQVQAYVSTKCSNLPNPFEV